MKMASKRGILYLIIVSVLISGCQPKEKIEIAEESIGSGFLEINTNPANADIFLDNAHRDKSPITLYNIEAGLHTITVKKDGYEDFTQEIIIEPGKKNYLEIDLSLIKAKEEPIVEVIEEKLETAEIEEKEVMVGTLKANGIINIGNKFTLYYDFSEGNFTENRQLDSDAFSKRFKQHLVFTRFDPVNIKTIDKNIDSVKKEDCINVKGQFEYLYSGQTLCVGTNEGEIAAIGGNWDNTEDAKLSWKVFS